MNNLTYFLEWTENSGYYYINGFWWMIGQDEGTLITSEQLLETFKKLQNDK